MLGHWLRALLPKACPGCGGQLGAQVGLCPECRASLQVRVEAHSPLRRTAIAQPHLVTLGRYQGVTRRAVRTLKYGGARDLAGVLGTTLACGVPAHWPLMAVIPVPLHSSRQRQRGFNQAQLLAQEMARYLDLPCLDALERTRATRQQAKQHAAQRDDMHGAFHVRPGAFQGQRNGAVLLVDDVLTTGSTLLACQAALQDAGISEIYAAVVAR